MYKPYPKWLYKFGESVIVQNEEEHKALGKEWKESPQEVVESDESYEASTVVQEVVTKQTRKRRG